MGEHMTRTRCENRPEAKLGETVKAYHDLEICPSQMTDAPNTTR